MVGQEWKYDAAAARGTKDHARPGKGNFKFVDSDRVLLELFSKQRVNIALGSSGLSLVILTAET